MISSPLDSISLSNGQIHREQINRPYGKTCTHINIFRLMCLFHELNHRCCHTVLLLMLFQQHVYMMLSFELLCLRLQSSNRIMYTHRLPYSRLQRFCFRSIKYSIFLIVLLASKKRTEQTQSQKKTLIIKLNKCLCRVYVTCLI